MAEFTHLHLHTAYSLLDGAIRLPDRRSRPLTGSSSGSEPPPSMRSPPRWTRCAMCWPISANSRIPIPYANDNFRIKFIYNCRDWRWFGRRSKGIVMSLLIDPRELIKMEFDPQLGPDRCGNCDCACYDGSAGPHQHCRCGHDWHDHLAS